MWPSTSSRSCFEPDDASTLLFLPLAHVFARIIQIGAVRSRSRLGHSADIKNLVADLQAFRPTFVLAVPRVFEKVFNTASQRATADGRGAIFDRAAEVAIAYSRGLDRGKPSIAVRAQHAVFSRLVYGKLREALGGRCEFAVSGGAPLGDRLGHFYRGIGVTVLEGYGLTETTAALTVNQPGALKIGTVGRPIPGTAVRIAEDGELLFKGGQVFAGYWRNDAATAEVLGRTAGSTPATSARSTTRASSGSPAARRRSWSPRAARTSRRPSSRTASARTSWSTSAWWSATAGRSSRRWSPSTARPSPSGPSSTGRPRSSADLVDDADLRAEIESAVDDANKAVSKAESIRKFRILPDEWTEEGGQLTPSLKLKRNVVMRENKDDVAALYL